MDEVALAGLLYASKFVQKLHSYMPKAWFKILAFLGLLCLCSGLPIRVVDPSMCLDTWTREGSHYNRWGRLLDLVQELSSRPSIGLFEDCMRHTKTGRLKRQ
jgi:hypothetical protein